MYEVILNLILSFVTALVIVLTFICILLLYITQPTKQDVYCNSNSWVLQEDFYKGYKFCSKK